jgi:hypothetical protein
LLSIVFIYFHLILDLATLFAPQMATNANAPYYQVARQFTTVGNVGNGTNAHFAPDDDYDLSASITPSNGPVSLYPVDNQIQESAAQGNTAEENRQLVELLEAANTAEAMNMDVNMDGNAGQGGGKRKRMSSSLGPDSDAAARDVPSDPKRARIDMPTDPSLQGTEANAQPIDHNNTDNDLHPSSETLLTDARAAGVHSAAALFRRSSKETARKYTRPPMSKLFMSLQLTPENFLHLQAQAKTYMLDPSHPDRQSCVGNRGKGDTDMVKLRLFNCVRDFLNDGVGEQFFGEHVEKPGERDSMEAARALGEKNDGRESKLVWPRDGNKIISLVTPLLRRMVTNERQRMYAIETRKGGSRRKEGSVEGLSVERELGTEMGYQHEQEQLQRSLHPINMVTPPPNLHPVQVQTPSQQSHPPSPTSTLPLHDLTPHAISSQPLSSSQADRHVLSTITRLNAGIPSLASNELPLPVEPSREPALHTINVYLTKCGVKLRPIKRVENDSKVLFEYTLAELKQEIGLLIQLGMSTYPALRPRDVGMGPEALRGLAVAATEMGNGERSPSSETPLVDVSGGIVCQPSWLPTSPTSQIPASALPDALPFTVQAIRSTGLSYVKHPDGRWDEETWLRVKKDVGHAVWAAGTVTLVVDLL